MADEVARILKPREAELDLTDGPKPRIVLVIGVNGSGKTTTIGKLANNLTNAGAKVVIGAADTFRAAAIEQLKVWADRSEASFVTSTQGADAAGVAFETVKRAKDENADVALIKALRGDRWGNLVYRGSGANFNPVMATAATIRLTW